MLIVDDMIFNLGNTKEITKYQMNLSAQIIKLDNYDFNIYSFQS